MLRTLLPALSLAVLALALCTQGVSAQSKPSGKEFKNDWNTWATAKEGDWAEYQIGKEIKRRYEVVKVSGDSITAKETLTANGKTNDPVEKKPTEWWKIRMLSGKIPASLNPVWSTAEIKVDDLTLKCDVVSWMNGNLSNEVYFCKDVPCGGLVKQLMNGEASVWLANFGAKDDKVGRLKGSDPNAGKAANLPAFFETAGNVSVHKVTRGAEVSYIKHTVLEGGSRTAKLTEAPCDKDGKVAPDAKVKDVVINADEWSPPRSKPVSKGEKVTVAAGEFTCNVFEIVNGAATTKEWLSSEGIVIKSETSEGGKVVGSSELVRTSRG